MSNRIAQLFEKQAERILNVYFTAGYPQLEDTLPVAMALQEAGADILEIGIPYSDPVADGPTIQYSNGVALESGISLEKIFEQIRGMRPDLHIPVILMGYVNVVLQYGMERFCASCKESGVDAVILPDLPFELYQEHYAQMFEQYGIQNVFLITPQTSEERIRMIDEHTNAFIYMVSSSSTTGAKTGVEQGQVEYFERVAGMGLKNPRLIGFGISDSESFNRASKYANGAIIGSKFISTLREKGFSKQVVNAFVKSIKQ